MQIIQTGEAPTAIGTYSQAVRVGDTVYLSGQIPLDPKTMQLCSDKIELQIKQVLDNLAAVCHAARGTFQHVVKLTVYLTDLAYFPLINEAMALCFKAPYPARVAIGVATLPRNALVEIDAIMVVS